jgi:hypothetical protein
MYVLNVLKKKQLTFMKKKTGGMESKTIKNKIDD